MKWPGFYAKLQTTYQCPYVLLLSSLKRFLLCVILTYYISNKTATSYPSVVPLSPSLFLTFPYSLFLSLCFFGFILLFFIIIFISPVTSNSHFYFLQLHAVNIHTLFPFIITMHHFIVCDFSLKPTQLTNIIRLLGNL